MGHSGFHGVSWGSARFCNTGCSGLELKERGLRIFRTWLNSCLQSKPGSGWHDLSYYWTPSCAASPQTSTSAWPVGRIRGTGPNDDPKRRPAWLLLQMPDRSQDATRSIAHENPNPSILITVKTITIIK